MSKKQKLVSFISGSKRKNTDTSSDSIILSPSKAKNWSETERTKLRELFDLGDKGLSLEQGGARADFYKGLDGLNITKAEYARRVRLRHPNSFLHCPEHRFSENFYNTAKKYLEEKANQGHRKKP